jgi:hypothetical protein
MGVRHVNCMSHLSLYRDTRGQTHWKQRSVSEFTRLAFNSSSVNLHAAQNDEQEKLDRLVAYK